MRKLVFTWLTCIVVITACAILCHTTMSQSLQYHLYDEQYKIIEQAKEQLNQNQTVENLVNDPIALETTKQCFIVVYDKVHAVSYTNATYQEKPLTVPLSLVVTKDDAYHESVYTPETNLRFATVSVAYDNGHIIVGQSMADYDATYTKYANSLVYVYGALCMILFPILWILHILYKNGKN